MMALGSSGGVGGMSSSSNLSASAPPFTIDRFSSKADSSRGLQYGDAAPFGHNWQCRPTPSAPQPEVEADSTRTTSMPISSGYTYRAAGSVNPVSTQWPAINPGDTSSDTGFYVSEARPYHPPFGSPVVSDKSSSMTLSQPMYDPSSIHGSSQVDYTENLSGVGYTPLWQGPWEGELGNGNQIRSGGSSAIESLNENSPFVFKNYIDKGPNVQSGNETRGDSGYLYGLSTVGIQMASHARSFNVRIPDGKSFFSREHDAEISANPIGGDENRRSKSFNSINLNGLSKSYNMMNVDDQSLYSQNLGNLVSESSGTQFQGPTSSYPDFSLPGTFQGSSKCFVNNQKTYGSQESCIQPLGSFVKDPTLPRKPACTVVIKAPAKSTSSSARDIDKIGGNKLASDCGSKLQDIPNLSEENGYSMSTRSESIEGSCYTNNSDREANYWNYIALTSKKEVPTNSQFDDSIDFILSTRPAFQTDNNVSHGFSPSSDYVQGYKHTEDPLENHILLDSPCWKGAQASSFSRDNIIESLPGIQFLKELDGCLDISGNRVGLTEVASQELSIGNPNFRAESAANDELPSQTNTSETSCVAKELNPNDAVKEVTNRQNPWSPKDGQFLNNSGKPIEEHNLSNNILGNEAMYSSSNQCNMENSSAPVEVNSQGDTRDGDTIRNEAADAGAVAYLAAENVLSSPPCQEVCKEYKQPLVEVATKMIDTSALVNAMHSLSEVLHSNCSSNLHGLTEENQESLKSVIRNLNACVSKKIVDSTPVSEHILPRQSISISTEDGDDLGKATGADQPHQKYQATVTSFGELGHQNFHHEKNYCDNGSQARCLPYLIPSEHNNSISSDNKMVQAIKQILDENLNFEEEMQPQVLLFKNLWLEAEARMCSISYRAHFNKMRVLMDEYKGKGITDDAGNAPCSKDSSNAKDTSLTAFVTENGAFFEGLITKQSSSSIDTISDNVDKSLLPRFSASFNHGDKLSSDEQHQLGVQRDGKSNEVQKQPSVLDTNNSGCQYGSSVSTYNPESQFNHDEAAVLTRLNMLKQRDDKLNEVQQHPNAHETNSSGYHWSSSSGWVPGQKDYFSWQKG